MSKTDNKKALLQTGMQFVLEGGYNHTGLNEVLAAANIPKGSFYYYFSSKEEFGLALIEEFDQGNKAVAQTFLKDGTFDPLTRLKNYFDYFITYLQEMQCRQGCLAGNMGQELSDQNETFRVRIKCVMDDWAGAIANCIKEAQTAGQIDTSLDPLMLGHFCLNNWEGAILQMKIAKNPQPLMLFRQMLFEVILKPC